MKKIGRYLLIVLPGLIAIASQFFCARTLPRVINFFYLKWVNKTGNFAVSTEEIMAYNMKIIMLTLLVSQLLCCLILGIWYKLQKRKEPRVKAADLFHGKMLGGIVLLGLGMQFLIQFGIQIAYVIFPEVIEAFEQLTEAAGLGEMNVLTLLAVVILAPLSEELTFRGVTMNLAKKASGSFLVANILQALMFGIFHLNIVQGVYAFVLGLVLGFVAHKYKSVVPSMLFHLVYNLGAMLLGVFGEALPETILTMILIAVVGVVLTVPGAWLIKKDEV